MANNSMSYRGAIRRIRRDLKEIEKEPIPGASLSAFSNTLFELHGNIVIPDGPYAGLLVHIVLKFDEGFPATSPFGRMGDGFPLGQAHHEHIHGGRLCNDYLRDFESFFKAIDGGERKSASGWSPGVTLKGLIMVLKQFFSETDLPPPSPGTVKDVFRRAEHYRCSACNHTSKAPFPLLPSEGDLVNNKSDKVEKDPAKERARSILVCASSKENWIDSPSMCLGYPLLLRVDSRNRLQTTLYPELTSYEQYVCQIQEKGIEKLENFNEVHLRSASGNHYTHWLPVYINEEHYQQNLQCIKNTISVISNGIEGTHANEFKPDMVLRVLPALMNKMVVALMDGELHESENAIHAFCHYLRLLMRFLDEYPSLTQQVEAKVKRFLSHRSNRSKSAVPDIGEFLVLLGLSSRSYGEREVKDVLLEEYFARQVFWIKKKAPDALRSSRPERLRKSFAASEVSLKLLVFDLMVTKWFIFPGIKDNLDRRFGVPPESVVVSFQKEVKTIKAMANYSTFLQVISLPGADMIDLLDNAIATSELQGYTKSYGGGRNGKWGGRYK